MNVFVIATCVMVGISLVGQLLVLPIWELLRSKRKASQRTGMDVANLILLSMWGMGMVMLGIAAAITMPQAPEEAMILIMIGGMGLIGVTIILIHNLAERRKQRAQVG